MTEKQLKAFEEKLKEANKNGTDMDLDSDNSSDSMVGVQYEERLYEILKVHGDEFHMKWEFGKLSKLFLSERDFKLLEESLKNPPKPNKALKKLMKKTTKKSKKRS